MRFGHFLYHNNLDPDRDAQALQEALAEARLAEELGYDAIWFSEHHFTGEVVYGDPMVFATAVAMQTKRVLLGFAVLEMAMHHPVRVAIQTALLDNLSRGRLLVGVARGSSLNGFEYRGFGTSVKEAREQIEEAEDLLLKAWTAEPVEHNGQFWQVSFPAARPRPYQKPHPPLFRACLSPESVASMAKQGKLVLFRTRNAEQAREHINLYRDTVLSAGFDEQAVEHNLDQCWMWRDAYVAESNDQAVEEFVSGMERVDAVLNAVRAQWNPESESEMPRPVRGIQDTYGGDSSTPFTSAYLTGSPERIKEWIADLRDAGVRNILLTHRGGVVSVEGGKNSIRLLAEKVFPYFK